MRNLTDDEVAHEVAMIENEDQWPQWPWLPVKNVHRHDPDCDYSAENDGLGMLLSPTWMAKAEKPIQVLFINMLDLPKALEDRRTGIPHKDFESVEAMVRAGWIGD